MLSQGALCVSFTEEGGSPVLEPGVGETPLWDAVKVTGLFPGATCGTLLASVLSLGPGAGAPERVELAEVAEQDWERVWLDDLEPARFGEDLWIVPTGHQPPEPGATIIRLDPGLAFGTGAHATTRLCLEWIERQDFERLTVVDYGCGSGVLGIAAALKGAERVYCVDNDPQALASTGANAARNRVGHTVEAVHAEAFDAPCADVVIANILAGTLVALAPRLCAMLGSGGRIALSGILREQAGEVGAVYADTVGRMKVRCLEEWALMTGHRRDSG